MSKQHWRNEIVIFFVLLMSLTALVFFWTFGSGWESDLTVAVMMWVPGIAALLTVAMGQIPLRELGWRPGKLGIGCWRIAFFGKSR